MWGNKFKIILNEPIPKDNIINDLSIALGEAYMTKKLEIEDNIQSVIESLYNNKESFLKNSEKYKNLIKKIKSNIKTNKDNIQFHYDIGNDFYKHEGGTNTWIDKFIFPGGYVPAIKDLITYIAEENFEIIDIESLRRHYGKTLECWAHNFEDALPEIEKTKDETFIRMWRLYLNACAASFNCGNINIHQILFAKGVNNDLPWTRNYM